MADVAMEAMRPLAMPFMDRADETMMDEHEDADMAEIEDAADELFEFVCKLSAACKANCNVLVDGALVDQLEAQGKEILRARGRENAPSVMSMMAALPRRRTLSAADEDDDMNMMVEAASRYEVLPANGYYATKEDMALQSPTQSYSPRLEGFKLDGTKTDLAASLASTYSTASMAHYDDVSDDEEYDEESVMTMSHLSLGMSLGLGERKYSTFSNTSEGSASRVLPYDIDPADEMFVQTLQDQVDSLLLENCKIVAENARLAEMSEMTAAEVEFLASKKQSAEELLRTQSQRLMSVEQALEETRGRHVTTSEKIREEMRAEFEAELATRTQELRSLQSELASKNTEIEKLSHNVDDISAAIDETSQEGGAGAESLISTLRQNNVVKETEILEMQETLLQKDREICSLYMHLSTKKKLIDEITRSFVKNMEEANEAKVPTSDVRFDLDTCLFKSVVDKEKRLDQLTAALSAMEQEVEDLESRIANKEREKHALNCTQQLLARTLCAMKSQLSQVEGEKVQLDAALNESQARIAALMESLEQKEKKIREFGRLSLPQGATILSC